MVHIRKRVLPSGKTRFQLVYRVKGKRVSEMFETKRQADERRIVVEGSKPSSAAPFTVLSKAYLDHMEGLVDAGQREQSYWDMLDQHIRLHIDADAEFSGLRCAAIGTPEAQAFLDRLARRVSAEMATKVRTTLSQIFTYGAQRGYVPSNPVREASVERTERPDAGAMADFILPGKNALRALLEGAKTFDETGRASAIVHTLMFGGLRMSELRGLRRVNLALVGAETAIDIVERADRYNVRGRVKSRAGRRTVDVGPATAQALRVWLLAAPKPLRKAKDGAELEAVTDYVFLSEEGTPWFYSNFRRRFWIPLMNHCGLVDEAPAEKTVRAVKGHEGLRAASFAPHTLRHVYASLQIEQGVTPKRLQKLMGHATLQMTLDTYGHLWPDEAADRERARGVEKLV